MVSIQDWAPVSFEVKRGAIVCLSKSVQKILISLTSWSHIESSQWEYHQRCISNLAQSPAHTNNYNKGTIGVGRRDD